MVNEAGEITCDECERLTAPSVAEADHRCSVEVAERTMRRYTLAPPSNRD